MFCTEKSVSVKPFDLMKALTEFSLVSRLARAASRVGPVTTKRIGQKPRSALTSRSDRPLTVTVLKPSRLLTSESPARVAAGGDAEADEAAGDDGGKRIHAMKLRAPALARASDEALL